MNEKIDKLLARLASWYIERRYLRWAEKLDPELTQLNLRRLEITPDGKFEGTYVTVGAAYIANTLAGMLNEAKADNYVEFSFLPKLERQIRPVRCTVQWESGLSPAQKAARLEDENKRLRRDYAVFEELAPPDIPREDFVNRCFDAWNTQAPEAQADVARLRGELEKIGERVGRWLAEPEAPDTGDLTLLATEIEWALGAQGA